MAAQPAPAALPPAGLPGLDPSWSRLVEVADAGGTVRTWHVLDNGVVDPVGTLLCVHGNPTWSYLWRRALAGAPEGWRVVAVDHLDMGFSERTGTLRRLADRIADLGALTDALGVTGPVVTLAHDWGGPISLGWALAHRAQLAGVVLTNTAVHQPPDAPAPGLIRLARTRGVHRATTVATPVFLRGTVGLLTPGLADDVRGAFLAPYRGARRRAAIGEFVEDIPLDEGHPSWPSLQALVAGLPTLSDVPVLLLWGPRDPVFSDRYLRDLQTRFPQAQVHRYEGAGHLVTEESPAVSDALRWVRDLGSA
ncbi:MAG: alpha/beta fold hydrolase, partial [Actinomycetia bacterium]|nr:alpha/beta fold hydrolase [Actinomycetes bacterium]